MVKLMPSRNIDDLTPDTAAKCRAFIGACKDVGIDVIITSTVRSNQEQAVLYAQGRTAPGNRVTNAGPGHSFHNWHVAFDFVPIVAGKAIWDDAKVWNSCGAIAESVGLEWGGRWKMRDKPHCQNAQGFTIDDFMMHKANVK